MTEAQKARIPGIFHRNRRGEETRPVSVTIERDRIRFFASVLGEMGAIHHDVEAAREAGYPDLVATPSFHFVVEACADEERHRQGELSVPDWIGCDLRYLLHGGEECRYEKPIFAGETVDVVVKILDFHEKKGGALEFAELETCITHPVRGLIMTSRRSLIHRLIED